MVSLLFGMLAAQPAVTAQQDHQELLKKLGISSLRPGRNGMNPSAPDFANTDESRANPYTAIPKLMESDKGKLVKTRKEWQSRRKEILEILDREIYGRTPKRLPKVKWTVVSTVKGMTGVHPTITKKLVGKVDNAAHPSIKVEIQMTLTTPSKAKAVPVVLEYGFFFPPRPGQPADQQQPPAAWQTLLLEKGWGYAILDPQSIQADNGGGLRSGIIGLVNKGQARKPDDWGALKAWAWGADRALDYFKNDKDVDSKRIAIEGLSRYGKAAIVAMAYVPRLSMAFVGSSGQGGVKIWRRNFGETVENIASSGQYHWMAGNYLKYAGPLTPNDMPVDAHHLVAICAPRPVFIGVGALKVEGIWIDPTGTFMATSLASPAYNLLGKKGLSIAEMPPEGTPLLEGELAFSQHKGGHTNGPNWENFITFASRYWDKKVSSTKP